MDDSESFVRLEAQLREAQRRDEEQKLRIQELEATKDQISKALKGANMRLAERDSGDSMRQNSFTVDEDLSPIKSQYARLQMEGSMEVSVGLRAGV